MEDGAATEHAAKADSTRSILYVLGANLAVAIAKLTGAPFTGSGALLA